MKSPGVKPGLFFFEAIDYRLKSKARPQIVKAIL